MKDALPQLHVQLLAHQPYLGNQHLALHFSQPLLAAGDFYDLTPGPNALDDIDKCTPLMQHILPELLGRTSIGVNRLVILPRYLTIDHDVLLTLKRLSDIFEQAARNECMTYETNFGLQ